MPVRFNLLLTLPLLPALLWGDAGKIDPARYKQTVRFLASDALKGRGTGTPELKKAAAYIAKEFKKSGLQPLGGSWFREFEVTTDARLGPKNALRASLGPALKAEQDFVPLNFSAAGSFSGEAVFAGYGITADEYGYDDYKGLDVKDKIVVVLRSEPKENDEKSRFLGKAFTGHSHLDRKAANARFHGAKALLFVNNNPAESDTVPRFSRLVSSGYRDLPFVQVKPSVVDEWLKPTGKSLRALIEAIDKDSQPQSLPLPGLKIDLEVDVTRTTSRVPNVAGFLPGETDEYVVLGAHFDHLGLGEQFSMAPQSSGKIHYGADDNASGTAGLLELARVMAKDPKRKRGVLFLAFAAEEMGLLGSTAYTNTPALPLNKAVAMINMDMIGRIKDKRAFVGGTGTGSTLKSLIEDLKPRYPLQLDLSDQTGYGSSDHMSFTLKQVPVLFFFSGLHSDYHRPTDTWEKINETDAATLLKLVHEATDRLAAAGARPEYVRFTPPAAQGAPGSGSRGYGADFGSIPDFAEVPDGFRIADVRPGSPAEKGGVKGGDIMFEFDGKPVKNLMDYSLLLRAKKPGDVVGVKVRRGGEVKELTVTLGTRSR